MTQSGKSLFFFGIYALCSGLAFILIPEKTISLTQLPSMPLGWARVVGLLALVIGSYDIFCGRANIQPFIKLSVYVRLGFALGAVVLFAIGQMPIYILVLGGADALGAAWTFLALKSEASKKQ